MKVQTARAAHAAAQAARQAGEALVKRAQSVVAGLRGLLGRVQSLVVPRGPTPQDNVALERRELIRVQRTALEKAQAEAKALDCQAALLQQVVAGATAVGMGGYLARAAPEARAVVHSVLGEACADGQARAGRHARNEPDAAVEERRRRKADRERERRRAAKAALETLPQPERERIEAELKARHREDRRQRRQADQPSTALDPAVDGSRPRSRQHEERIAKAAPDQQAMLTARIISARERGRAAAARDADARASHGATPWRNLHAPIRLPDGCSLVAIRGGNRTLAETTAAILKPGGLERWLLGPALERESQMGGRSRLVCAAGHLTAAWSDILKDLARSGHTLEEAAAYRIDQIIARLDLDGHRVAAYWHTDSNSGHPHVHLVWARVRDEDLSLWTLESRARASALWLHARSNTVMAAGPEALQADVDALGGLGEAAVDAGVLMAHDALVAHRRLIDGTVQAIPLQGQQAAHRLAHVGIGPQALAGGVWRFGLGPDPIAYKAWNRQLAAAQRSGSPEEVKAIMSSHPKNRGYWLPLEGVATGLSAVLATGGFGTYLGRKR